MAREDSGKVSHLTAAAAVATGAESTEGRLEEHLVHQHHCPMCLRRGRKSLKHCAHSSAAASLLTLTRYWSFSHSAQDSTVGLESPVYEIWLVASAQPFATLLVPWLLTSGCAHLTCSISSFQDIHSFL